MTLEAPHILVVDDDRRLRELLRKYLAENGFRVTTAESAADARAKLASLAFDLLVLDVMMPGEDGFVFTRSLRTTMDVPILLLTARVEAEDRIDGLERGADDYLTKPFEPRELVLRITGILRRAQKPEPAAPPVPGPLRLGPCVFDNARGELSRAGRPIRLAPSELRVLRTLAAAPGQAVSREDLRQGSGADGTVRAVDVQITRLRRKIEADPKAPRYLQTVRGSGYALVPD